MFVAASFILPTLYLLSATTSTIVLTNMAASNVTALAAKLRSTLKNSTVLTPDSEGYVAAIIRWSDEMEKRAVSRT